MTKKNLFLILLALLLAALSFYLNRDRFRSQTIQIGERWTEPRGWMARRNPKSNSKMLIFLFNQKVQLTSLKVVQRDDLKTNKYPHAVWQLTTDSNSIALKDCVYGMPIRGMKPTVKGATADPLQPGVDYRLLIEAGPLKAEHDFTAPPATP
ncbi:MAG: hypothetical protein ACTHKU_00465 [Verrucomicrobiota bacterium]